MPKLIIVSGTRPHPALTSDARIGILRDLTLHRPAMLMHGGAQGVDSVAARWWNADTQICMPAQWDRLGKYAGPARNQAMVDIAVAMHECGWDVVALCYPVKSSRGTRDMIERLQWRRGYHVKHQQEPHERWTVIVRELEE